MCQSAKRIIDTSSGTQSHDNNYAVLPEKIFTPHVILDYYIFWERIIETLVINENFDAVYKFVSKVVSAISELQCKKDKDSSIFIDRSEEIKRSMYRYLFSVLIRSYSLIWKDKALSSAKKIFQTKINAKGSTFGSVLDDWFNSVPISLAGSPEKQFEQYCLWYCRTRMIDKSVLPVPVDMLLLTDDETIFSRDINLTNFQNAIEGSNYLSVDKKDDMNLYMSSFWDYIYYPYIVSMSDISIVGCIFGVLHEDMRDCLIHCWDKIYAKINYSQPF